MTTKIPSLNQLYDRDYHLWLEETAQLLKTKNFSQLDIKNLIILFGLGKSDRFFFSCCDLYPICKKQLKLSADNKVLFTA